MPSDYEKIRRENIKGYGTHTHHLSFLGELYTERTHFVFELLQNAEDAGATRILFTLFEDSMEVAHDGRPFNEKDVRGICGVGEGTKARNDLTQIGKFGIGFKSVYAYTTEPEVHSGDESFRIKHYVRPFGVKPRPIVKPWTTLFDFKFGVSGVPSKQAYDEIGEALRNLDVKTLLFLRKIKEINYSISGLSVSGVYLRGTSVEGPARRVKVARRINGLEETVENWLTFPRPVAVPSSDSQVFVEIGFRLDLNTKDNTECIVAENNTPLVVYFLTEKPTGLGFLVQGPYRTTPARDNVPSFDSWNKKLIEETAELVVDSLRYLKSVNLLSVALLEALPIRSDDFPEDGMFYPIFHRVRKALKDEELLPTPDGAYVAARNAKLFSAMVLMEILGQDQRVVLFPTGDQVKWLSDKITERRTRDLHSYIKNVLEVEEVTPESFVRKITERFLDRQTDEWFIVFYEFLSEHSSLWRYAWWDSDSGILRNKPILRLQDGTHVKPFNEDGTPNAYLAIEADTETSLPLVKTVFSRHEGSRKFLEALGIPELDLVVEVIETILPRYRDDKVSVDPRQNRHDLEKIERAYKTDSQERKIKLCEALSNVPFILAHIPSEERMDYRKPDEIYFRTEELCMYFEDNASFAFIDQCHPQFAILEDLGVARCVRTKRRESRGPQRYVTISDSWGHHRRGRDGFDPAVFVDGIEHALEHPTIEKSVFIWNTIALPNRDCVRGIVEKSTRQDYAGSSTEEQWSEFGKLLTESEWLPDSNGMMQRPCDLLLKDLHKSVFRDDKLADQLGMKKDAIVNLAKELDLSVAGLNMALNMAQEYNNSPEFRRFVDSYHQKKKKVKSAGSEHVPYGEALSEVFSEIGKPSIEGAIRGNGTSRNSARRRAKTQESITEAIENKNINDGLSFFAQRKQWKGKDDSIRACFIDWYGGRCQICNKTFVQRNGEPYFEGLYLVSRTSAEWFDREGNVLCLCAEHSAMFQFGPKEVEEDIVQQVMKLKVRNEGGDGNLAIQMKLCERPVEINYAENHLIDLQEMIRVDN